MSLRGAFIGRGGMGAAVCAVWRERGHEVAVVLGRGDDLAAAREADVAFEFTRPEAAAANVEALLRARLPTVCGTTGWDPEPARSLAADLAVPLLVAPNFAIGVAVLRELVGETARRLGGLPEFEPGIVERHHSRKLDSPSGTARMLAGVVAEISGAPPPVVALRQGGQPGEHRVVFEGAEETLELVHRARSRRVFALGAVHAAEWLVASGIRGPVTFAQFLDSVRA